MKLIQGFFGIEELLKIAPVGVEGDVLLML
jgi:hypothetical protein